MNLGLPPLRLGGPADGPGPAAPPPDEPDTLDLLGPVLALWAYRRLIAVTTGLAGILAILYALSIEPAFTGVAQVQIGGRENVIDIEGVAGRLSPDDETVSSEVGAVTANAVLRRVVLGLQLHRDPYYGDEDEAREAPLGAMPDDRTLDAAVGALRRSLQVRQRGASFLVEIAATADAPRKAALVANAVSAAYLTQQIEARARAAERAGAFLSAQLTEMDGEIEAAEDELTRLRTARLDAFGESPQTTEARLERVAERLAAAQADRAEAEARARLVGTLEASGEGLSSLPEVVGSDLVARLSERVGELRAQEAALLTRSGERHPDVVSLRAEIADREALMAAEMARIARGLERDFERAADAEAELARLTRALEDRLVSQDQQGVRLASLQAEIDTYRDIRQSFLTRFREVSETASLLLPDARVVSEARPPRSGSGPSRRLIVAMALFLGFALGCLVTLVIEALDQTVHSGRQAERLFFLPHLGSLPHMRRLRGRRPWRGPDPESKGDRRLIESLRDVRTALLTGAATSSRTGVLGVTSATSGEGKSTTAALLAWSLSELGRSVVLVEGDLRSPSIGRVLAPDAQTGLSHVLRGEARLHEAVVAVDAGFDLLPAGRSEQAAANILLAPALGEAFDALRERYEHVVVDLPPAGPVNDVLVLGPELDGALMVLRWNKTTRSSVRGAVSKLGAHGVRTLGVVLTMVEASGAKDDERERMESKYYAGA